MKKIILSLDFPVSEELVDDLNPYLGGVKIGWPLILSMERVKLESLVRRFQGIRILDLKLADIDNTMEMIVNNLRSLGNAFIAHSFIGVQGALDKLVENEIDLFLVVSMSHPGWNDAFYPYLREIASKINEGVSCPSH
ncbi:orotidine 5'-phosphate decarboxylase / HUMPS family protein [Metallosphaera hakonensis]|uniref:orotidine 5'-phosphate decarboxylase / HUMPS family protein n=1 Tax=Metallosphaera hakonensis TaxID=79601 RepID=UPI000AA3939F|nr:orotidine 5'-phosphate decarboxylase / HUMPS family protein [Metallosphaera hakonensis]